jgi:hypothetical protein
MELNSIIFPSPKSSYAEEDFKGQLIWIPRKLDFSYKDQSKYNNFKSLIPNQKSQVIKENGIIQKVPKINFSFNNKFSNENIIKKEPHIPCLYLPASNSNKMIIYFHANYEDLGQTHTFLHTLMTSLQINVLGVEYPGYGIYSGSICDADKIIEDATIIYKFLINVMNIKEESIILLGRCIGSGPGSYLASKNSPGALVLISPFTSIKDAVKSLFERTLLGWLAEKLVSER